MIQVEVNNQQSKFPCEERALRDVVERVLQRSGCEQANVSIAVVDNSTIHELNRQFLQHDYPTDVLSFVYDESPLNGELILSAEQAHLVGPRYGWSGELELLLYAVHGTLHLTGFDDQTDELRQRMQREESAVLNELGYPPPPRHNADEP